MGKRKKKTKTIEYVDEQGNVHCIIDPASIPNPQHLHTQQTIKHTVVEDKRKKKPRYKNKDLEDE